MIGLTTTLDSYKLCRLSSLFQKDNGTIPKQHLNPELSTFLAVGLLTQAAMSAFFPPFFLLEIDFFIQIIVIIVSPSPTPPRLFPAPLPSKSIALTVCGQKTDKHLKNNNKII